CVVNLVVNAIDALKDETGSREIRITTEAESQGARVVVADDGPGMPEEVASKVFDPFFTTKGASGTGLGLANCYAFAERSQGAIELVTAPGEGARFVLWLPRPP
ncbi:MAG: HAMP domain-containing sensor histidine kinase, partial [Myxococcota bacterium]